MPALSTLLPLLFVAMMRPLGAMLLMPMFGSTLLGGALIRNTLALIATFPVWPLWSTLTLPDPLQAPTAYAALLAGELAVGVVLGFSAAMPFWAIDAAGFVLDTMRGASMGGVLNPLLGVQSSVLGMLFSQLVLVLFLTGGGFHTFMGTLYQSYRTLPPGQAWGFGSHFLPFLQRDWQTLYTLGLGFALPGIVIMVLIDIGLGMINRTVQQMNVFSLAMPIKSLAVLLVLLGSIQFGLRAIEQQFQQDNGLIHALAPRDE